MFFLFNCLSTSLVAVFSIYSINFFKFCTYNLRYIINLGMKPGANFSNSKDQVLILSNSLYVSNINCILFIYLLKFVNKYIQAIYKNVFYKFISIFIRDVYFSYKEKSITNLSIFIVKEIK